MEQLDIQIITVISENFVRLEDAINDTGKGAPDGISLQDLLATLNNYVESVKRIDQEIRDQEDLGRQAVFIPYQSDGQWLEAISRLPATIIVVRGIDQNSAEFAYLEHRAWHLLGKLITTEEYRELFETFPQKFIDLHLKQNPRNPQLPSANTRPSTKAKDRYGKFVALVNDGKTMKEIAVEMGLSVPSTYNFRKIIKVKLENDPNVDKSAPAMKFNEKRG